MAASYDEGIVKFTELLDTPPTVTTTGPDVAFAGTGAEIDVADHDVGAASVPLNDTVLDPGVKPKFVPVIVTVAPGGACVAESVVMEAKLKMQPD